MSCFRYHSKMNNILPVFKIFHISDWMIIEDNKLIGGYTIKNLRNKMTEEERKAFDGSFGVIIE